MPKRHRVLVRTTRILPPGLTFTGRIWLLALIMLSLLLSLPEEIVNFHRVVRVDWPEIQLVVLGVSSLPSSSHHLSSSSWLLHCRILLAFGSPFEYDCSFLITRSAHVAEFSASCIRCLLKCQLLDLFLPTYSASSLCVCDILKR